MQPQLPILQSVQNSASTRRPASPPSEYYLSPPKSAMRNHSSVRSYILSCKCHVPVNVDIQTDIQY